MAASPSNLCLCSSASSFDDDNKSQKKHIVSSFYLDTASDDIHEYPPHPLWIQIVTTCTLTIFTGYTIWITLFVALVPDLKRGVFTFRDILGIFLSLLFGFMTIDRMVMHYRMAKAGLQ